MKNREMLKFELNKPLLIIKEGRGFLACGYINVDTCNATGDACAIVRGVNTYEEMENAVVVAISDKAAELGVKLGDIGKEALKKFA